MRYFWGLDLIRFVSALMVVMFHFGGFGANVPAWPVPASEAPLGWLQPVGWLGWVGVQIFFVLSGFVIAASARGSTFGVFLKKRAIRLLPVLWLSAALALIVRALWGEPLGELLPAFLKTLVLSPKGPYIDGVVWTLVVEAAFYLCTALVILLAPILGGTERALDRFALLLGAASGAFTLFYFACKVTSGPIAQMGAALPLGSFAFDVTLLRQGVFFALGMLMYQAVDQGMTSSKLWVMMGLSALCMLQIFNNVGQMPAALAPIAVWSVAAALIYLGARFGDRVFTRDVRPIMRPIGLMTYPLYLNHFVLGAALMPILAGWIANTVVLFVVMLAILLFNAWFMAQYLESWAQRHLKRALLGSPRVRQPASQLREARP
ncbi:acyltransferase [Erythrobacter sp. THAF29]|uniref:acyltransferase family protein n=1 Tax=Erythrobacter sp. THAF29 TaxID=2587851 RepID=UPI0012680433|nr:acyltransferase [Erythrobacter sp. THAF29]QFT77349.1 Acyltransferase family protein [Erythrobacter sp. THAF29]